MKLETFAYRLAFVWLCFRMLADMAKQTLNGLVAVLHATLAVILNAALIGLLALGLYWLWKTYGDKLPL